MTIMNITSGGGSISGVEINKDMLSSAYVNTSNGGKSMSTNTSTNMLMGASYNCIAVKTSSNYIFHYFSDTLHSLTVPITSLPSGYDTTYNEICSPYYDEIDDCIYAPSIDTKYDDMGATLKISMSGEVVYNRFNFLGVFSHRIVLTSVNKTLMVYEYDEGWGNGHRLSNTGITLTFQFENRNSIMSTRNGVHIGKNAGSERIGYYINSNYAVSNFTKATITPSGYSMRITSNGIYIGDNKTSSLVPATELKSILYSDDNGNFIIFNSTGNASICIDNKIRYKSIVNVTNNTYSLLSYPSIYYFAPSFYLNQHNTSYISITASGVGMNENKIF